MSKTERRDLLVKLGLEDSIVFENPDNSFVVDSVEEELAFTLENMIIQTELYIVLKPWQWS